MSVKYIPNGNVKIVIEKVSYQNKDGKNAVLPADKIGKEELENLLKRRLIKKLELDEEAGDVKEENKEKRRPPKNRLRDEKPEDKDPPNDEKPRE